MRKKPTASNSRDSRSVGTHGLAARSSIGGGVRRRAGEQIVLAVGARLQRAVAGRDDAVDIGEGRGAVDAKLVEGAGGGERLERALVDEARIDARGEVAKRRGTRPPLLPLGADMLDRLAADILQAASE